MSEREVKTKRILYKEVKICGQSKTLQELLSELLEKRQKADSRKELVNPNEEDLFRLINRFEIFQGMLFCQLVAFEPGHSQRYIQLQGDAESYAIKSVTSAELSQLSDEDANEARDEHEKIIREFIDSILYFGVLGNNLVIMQSRSLTTRELETHLRYILGTLSKSIDETNLLVIRDKPREDVINQVMKRPVKSVTIGAPVEAASVLNNAHESSWLPSGTGADILKAAFSERWDNFIKGTTLTDCLDDANLEVRLIFTYKRKTSDNGERILRNIADAARHYPDEDVTIEMVGGTKLSGKEIRLWNKVNVVSYNSLIDEHNLYGQMHEWLTSLLINGEAETYD